MVRVWSFDKDKIAPIAEVGSLKAPAGAGPRHGFFKVMKSGETFFIFNGELDQKVYSYRVKYTRTGLSFTKVFEITSLNEKFPPNTAPISEIAMSVSLPTPVVILANANAPSLTDGSSWYQTAKSPSPHPSRRALVLRTH